MAYLLAIETATKVCSVGLFKNNELIALKEEKGNYSHAENVAVFTDELLKENQLNSSSLSAVVVSKGPGSYTGLRIGVSFAKGLCYALNIPLISIDTLTALTLGFNALNNLKVDLICSMIDARRMEVYAAIYDSDVNLVKLISADIITEESYKNIVQNKKIVFIGDGVAKCESTLTLTNQIFKPEFICSAKHLGQEGYKKFENQEFENVAYFEPFYLKEFVALKSKKSLL